MQTELQQRQIADILARCEEAAVPSARVGHPDDLSTDPHLRARGLLSVALSPQGEKSPLIDLPGLPMEFGPGRDRPSLDRQPPSPNEHASEILAGAGYGPDEISDLIERRIVAKG